MGGIAGIVRFDGQEVNPDDVNEMIRLLRHRGEVSSTTITNGVVMSLGGSIENHPQVAVIAAVDANIFSAGYTDQPFCRHFTEAGPASFNKINADFSVALWDPLHQALYCARDHLGIKPLYYVHQPNHFFAFASEIKGLTVLREVIIKANRSKFRDYLTWKKVITPYNNETFYEGIYSVLPGHYLKVTSAHTEETPFWKPEFSRYDRLGGIDAYASVFRDVFTNAVAARINSKSNIGAHLSGGLDSSSVCSIAQSLLRTQGGPSLYTFNVDTEQRLAEEQSYVQDVVSQWGTAHYRVKPAKNILEEIQKINYMFDRPEHFVVPSSLDLSAAYQAKKLGCDLILSGHGGDNVASYGFNILNDQMDAGDWAGFKTAGEKYFQHYKRNLAGIEKAENEQQKNARYKKFIMSLLVRNFKKRYPKESLLNLLKDLWANRRRFDLSETDILLFLSEKISNRLSGYPIIKDVVNPEFKTQGPSPQFRSTSELVYSIFADSQISVEGIMNNGDVMSHEQMNHIGAYHGYAYSFPFLDKEVIDLCLSTPTALSFDSGRGRGLIRHGMEHVLPPSVVSRTTKANFVEYGTLAAEQLYLATREHLSSPGHAIWEVVDQCAYSKIASIVLDKRISAKAKARYNWQLNRIIYLSVWLDSLTGGSK